MDLKELGIDKVKMLPSTPPAGSKMVNSLTMEATVDVNQQPLKILRPFILAVAAIPPLLPPEAQIVLQNLFSCFEKKKDVSEGLIGDVLWGFAQCGIPAECSYRGLQQLEAQGYIKFQTPDNSYCRIEDDQADKAFVRYQKKLLDLVYV